MSFSGSFSAESVSVTIKYEVFSKFGRVHSVRGIQKVPRVTIKYEVFSISTWPLNTSLL